MHSQNLQKEAQLEARMGHYGKHWYVSTPLTLKGRGVVLVDTHSDPRRNGWYCYKVTNLAFATLQKQYAISTEALL